MTPEAEDVARIFRDDIDPSREPCDDGGKLPPSGRSSGIGSWVNKVCVS